MKQYPGGTHTVQYGTTEIEFELIHTDRDDLAIHVHPDGSVVAEAPAGSEVSAVESKVLKRARWIVRQQETFQEYTTSEPNRLYVSGETHYYLGRRYRLKVVEDERERVRFYRGRIFLHTESIDNWHHKRNLMQKWYRTRARFIFKERLSHCYTRFESLDIPVPDLQIRAMKSQWGSCTFSGKITLNLKLIKVPRKLIDYVIIHELCHLKEHNHSDSFYRLLAHMLPDWEALRQELNQWDFQ